MHYGMSQSERTKRQHGTIVEIEEWDLSLVERWLSEPAEREGAELDVSRHSLQRAARDPDKWNDEVGLKLRGVLERSLRFVLRDSSTGAVCGVMELMVMTRSGDATAGATARRAAALAEDEEKARTCRICYGDEQDSDEPLHRPCGCRGSLARVHASCLVSFLRSKGEWQAGLTCASCRQPFVGECAAALARAALEVASERASDGGGGAGSLEEVEMARAQVATTLLQRGEHTEAAALQSQALGQLRAQAAERDREPGADIESLCVEVGKHRGGCERGEALVRVLACALVGACDDATAAGRESTPPRAPYQSRFSIDRPIGSSTSRSRCTPRATSRPPRSTRCTRSAGWKGTSAPTIP